MFRWLCHALARALYPGPGDTAPAWPDDPADVEALVTLSGHHLVTPALAHALRGNDTVPPEAAEYLEAALYLNRQRNDQIVSGLEIAVRALSEVGVAPILLKGGANLVDGLYPDPAMRIVGDLDLLVAPDSASAASEALSRAGFDDFGEEEQRPVPYARHHHLPMQSHRESGVGIEVHRAVLPAPFDRMLDAAQLRRRALPLAFGGRAVALPSPTDRVLHNIVHDQLVDGAYHRRSANLRQLLDLSLLCHRHRGAIDWGEMEAAFAGRKARVLTYALDLTGLLETSPPTESSSASIERLRKGIEHPRSLLRTGLQDTATRVIRQPGIALNLLAPRTWGNRARHWASLARRPRA